jgi:hypothetical protein
VPLGAHINRTSEASWQRTNPTPKEWSSWALNTSTEEDRPLRMSLAHLALNLRGEVEGSGGVGSRQSHAQGLQLGTPEAGI